MYVCMHVGRAVGYISDSGDWQTCTESLSWSGRALWTPPVSMNEWVSEWVNECTDKDRHLSPPLATTVKSLSFVSSLSKICGVGASNAHLCLNKPVRIHECCFFMSQFEMWKKNWTSQRTILHTCCKPHKEGNAFVNRQQHCTGELLEAPGPVNAYTHHSGTWCCVWSCKFVSLAATVWLSGIWN